MASGQFEEGRSSEEGLPERRQVSFADKKSSIHVSTTSGVNKSSSSSGGNAQKLAGRGHLERRQLPSPFFLEKRLMISSRLRAGRKYTTTWVGRPVLFDERHGPLRHSPFLPRFFGVVLDYCDTFGLECEWNPVQLLGSWRGASCLEILIDTRGEGCSPSFLLSRPDSVRSSTLCRDLRWLPCLLLHSLPFFHRRSSFSFASV